MGCRERAARAISGAGEPFHTFDGKTGMNENAGLAVIAVGGNALILDEDHRSIPDQYRTAAAMCHSLGDLVAQGWRLVIVHGNGPQVGFVLRSSEIAAAEVPEIPMDYATGNTQGVIGWIFQRALGNELRRRGMERKIVAMVTQVRVDRDDPAFANPTKPIGAMLDEASAKALAAEQGWVVKEDAGRGWRRVVPSPRPLAIVEMEVIRDLMGLGTIVIACGVGGIPVIENDQGEYLGVEAVIDKDLTASLLATAIDADLFLISTGVERVALNFNSPQQEWLSRVTLDEARGWRDENHFDPGSMGPKVQAMIEFLEGGGKKGLITDPPNIGKAMAGETGTCFARD